MRARVRCPAEGCGAVFEIPVERLGRNVYCLSCGTRMTARPVEAEYVLDERERARPGGAGATVTRFPLVAVLDDVRSLWNVGSMFRSADACGFESLALAGITGCPPRPEIRKTALGADEVVAWSWHRDVVEAIEGYRTRGFVPVALETSGTGCAIGDLAWPERACLVVGNEVAGISPRALAACTMQAAIPMYGVKSSLNVAVAFGIAAHAAASALVQSTTGAPRRAPGHERETH